MRYHDAKPDLGSGFSTFAALMSPGHAAFTGKPLYEGLAPLGLRPSAGRFLARIGRVLSRWHERSNQRRQLQGLSDHLLNDLGLNRADVEVEGQKRFWQA
jgi:uncharacterized protein YjiS (DUF1127 family)